MKRFLVLCVFVTVAAFAAAPASAQTAGGDAAVGTGTFQPGGPGDDFTFTTTINAQSGPNGENAGGTFSYSNSDGLTFAGTVTCLRVTGNVATLGGLVTSETYAGSNFDVTVYDNGVTGDQISHINIGLLPVNCTNHYPASSTLTSGNYVVSDNTVITPLCQVTIGGWIIAANGDRASFGGTAKVGKDGKVRGEQLYRDRGPAQTLTVKSTRVLAVTCSGTEATIHGTARIDGAGQVLFRIQVSDLSKNGKGDRYGILLSNGYYSGDRQLRGGNITIKR